MRAAVSETAISGSLPMSEATIESICWTEFFLRFCADSRLRRRPVTTMSSPTGSSATGVACAVAGGWSAGVAVCAAAGSAVPNTSSDVDPRMIDFRRMRGLPFMAFVIVRSLYAEPRFL